jgi:hypothetical protein
VSTQLTAEHIFDHRGPLLAELQRRQAVVRDYVRGVALQYRTGLYLFGPPGTAKTYTVRSVLGNEAGRCTPSSGATSPRWACSRSWPSTPTS